MDQMCVRATNALMRLCIAQALLSCRCKFGLLVGMCFKYFLRLPAQRRSDFVPEKEANFSSISKYVLNTYKMYMKTLNYLIYRIRCLILVVKGKNN